MAKYRKGKQINAGGFGVLYEGICVDDNTPCVLKYLKPDYDEDDLRRFKREVRLQTQLQHPNITPIVASNLDAEPPWFVMPKAAMNLRQFVSGGWMDDARHVFKCIAKGVAHAHANGVIHRDLKPEHILVFGSKDDGWRFVVADFGLGRKLDRDTTVITQTNMPMGSIAYMAPEQWTSPKTADARADIYSLGKMPYELLSGRFPHPYMDWSVIERKYVYVLDRATQNQPDDRYRSVSDMLEALELISKGTLFDKPATAIQSLIQEIMAQEAPEEADMTQLMQLICDSTNDYAMMANVFPRIPDPLLAILVKRYPVECSDAFRRYDEDCTTDVTFEYCDVIADFYERVFDHTDNDEIRAIILKRLACLGPNNNRWHVGSVFACLVSGLSDEHLILITREVLAKQPRAAHWNKPYLKGYTLPKVIRDVLPDSD